MDSCTMTSVSTMVPAYLTYNSISSTELDETLEDALYHVDMLSSFLQITDDSVVRSVRYMRSSPPSQSRPKQMTRTRPESELLSSSESWDTMKPLPPTPTLADVSLPKALPRKECVEDLRTAFAQDDTSPLPSPPAATKQSVSSFRFIVNISSASHSKFEGFKMPFTLPSITTPTGSSPTLRFKRTERGRVQSALAVADFPSPLPLEGWKRRSWHMAIKNSMRPIWPVSREH